MNLFQRGIFIGGNILTNTGSFQYIIIQYSYSRMRLFSRASLFYFCNIAIYKKYDI